jgi:hypothetical protein
MVDSAKIREGLRNRCYLITPRQVPVVCAPNMPLTITNIDVIRLSANDRYGMKN